MKASGPRTERETIVNFNEEESTASIWTASEVVYRRLIKQLGTESLLEDGERHAIFELPKAWIKLPRQRKVRVPTPKQLEARRLFGTKRTQN